MEITFYEPDGAISGFLSSDKQTINLNKSLNPNWVQGAWDRLTHYVVNGEAVERPVNPAILTNQTLTNLPVPCKIVINGTEYECNDSQVDLELPMVNEYLITVVAFPYLDAEFEIET